MKIVFLLVISFAGLFFVKGCNQIDINQGLCNVLDTVKPVALSTMQQLRCTRDPSPPNPDSFDLTFEENGKMFKCAKVGSTDPGFDHSAIYPVSPPTTADTPLAFSYTRIGANSEHTVNCIQPANEMDEIIYSASKGFFPVTDINQNRKFLCTHAAAAKLEPMMTRVGRAFSKFCSS